MFSARAEIQLLVVEAIASRLGSSAELATMREAYRRATHEIEEVTEHVFAPRAQLPSVAHQVAI